jgi:DDE superfamily endonuclease
MTAAMNEFLQQLCRQYNHYRIILILDKAGWHTSKTLQLANNIQLLHLNLYLSEHNPMELL